MDRHQSDEPAPDLGVRRVVVEPRGAHQAAAPEPAEDLDVVAVAQPAVDLLPADLDLDQAAVRHLEAEVKPLLEAAGVPGLLLERRQLDHRAAHTAADGGLGAGFAGW